MNELMEILPNVDGVIVMIDSTDHEALPELQTELQRVIKLSELPRDVSGGKIRSNSTSCLFYFLQTNKIFRIR